MQRQGRRDTKPELALRRELHRRGYRYYVDRPPLPGLRRRADLVFPRLKVAVYVDGCFWHSCPDHATTPKNNHDWWIAKLAGNVTRDRDTDARLAEAGWRVIRFWEHADPIEAANQTAATLAERRSAASIRRPADDHGQVTALSTAGGGVALHLESSDRDMGVAERW